MTANHEKGTTAIETEANRTYLRKNRSNRIGCLWVPDLPLSALARIDPTLGDRPTAIVQEENLYARVVVCNPQARSAGVVPGMTAAAAHSLLPDLIVRPFCATSVRSAQAALLDVARSFSPRVALEPAGEICMDLNGLENLFASEQKLGSALLAKTRKIGLDARAGIAATKLCARLAARTTGGLQVVPSGKERAFLAPLAIDLLPDSAKLQENLHRFGITRLGALADLPPKGLSLRLGPAGLRLWRQARGEDDDPLVAMPLPKRMQEETDCDHPIGKMEPLLFAVQHVVERIFARCETLGFSVRSLFLSLGLDPTGTDERSVQSACATVDVSSWLELIKTSLEKTPPRQPVVRVGIEAETTAVRHTQLDLFARRNPGRSAPKLDDTLARLTALAGQDRVGTALPVDTHLPGGFVMAPFSLKTSGGKSPQQPERLSEPPLRAIRPALRINIHFDKKKPVYIQGDRLAGRVLRIRGPWRLEGNWWQVDEIDRDYYEALLANGASYRLYRDRLSDQWYADGIYG